MEVLPLEDFKIKILNSSSNYFGITNYIRNLTTYDFARITLDNSYTTDILNNLDLHWPKIDIDYILKILNYLKNYKFIGDSNEIKETIF